VCRSVSHDREPCKRGRLECGLELTQGTMY